MPPRYVHVGQKNLLLYLFIWFSFTISNRTTVQFDYDVPSTSPVKNVPGLDSQFDPQPKNNDFGVDTQSRDFPNPALNRGKQSEKKHGRTPVKYRRSVISRTTPKDFAQTSISGQSTEQGNNKSPYNFNSTPSVNTTGYVKPSTQSNNQRNATENAFDRINNISATTNNSLNNIKSISQNRTVASLNHTVNGTKIEGSRDNNAFSKEWNRTSENKNNSRDKNSSKTSLKNEIVNSTNNSTLRNISGDVTDNNQTFSTGKTNNVTKNYTSILTNETVNGNENILFTREEKSKETKNFTGIGDSAGNNTSRNQINVTSSKTETPIVKTDGNEHSTTEESVKNAGEGNKNAPETEMRMKNSKSQNSKPLKKMLTSFKTDTPLNGHLGIITPPQSPEYRSDKPRKIETESIPDMATKMSENQQASNRLNPSQPELGTLETTWKPDLHLLTPEATEHNILTTSDKNKETKTKSKTLLKKLIQTTTSDGKKAPETPKPVDDTEYKPEVEAISNNEEERKYKTKSNEQSKKFRMKVLGDFLNDLRGLCIELSDTKHRSAVAIADMSLTTILTPFSGKSNTFFEICPLKNKSPTEIKNSFAIGKELEEKYKSWECVKNAAKCDGLCLGITHLISHYVLDIFTNKRLSRKQAYRSSVVQLVLINPKDWTKLETNRLSKPVEFKLQLSSNEVPKDFEIACCVWEQNMWNKSACRTVAIQNTMIHCACDSLGYTAAFLIEGSRDNNAFSKEWNRTSENKNNSRDKNTSKTSLGNEIVNSTKNINATTRGNNSTLRTTTSDGKNGPETPKPKINKKRRSSAPVDDTEYKPEVEALSNNEVERKYKTKSNEQPKKVRKEVLEHFLNDLRGFCIYLNDTNDRTTVALADMSLTSILTPFSGKSNTFFEISPLKNESLTEIKNSFAIGKGLEEKYKSWECVKNAAKCDGLCLGITHLISHYVLDIFTNRRLSRKQAYRSTVVHLALINPKDWTKLETNRLSKPVEYKLQLYSNEVPKDFEIACCVWERNMWNKSACRTVALQNTMIHCACDSLGYTAAFLIESGASDVPLDPLSTDMKKKLNDLNKTKKKSMVNYKFEIDADYNQTVGNDKKATEEWFRGQIAKQLNMSKDSISRVIIEPECDDCDVANDSTGQNEKVRDLNSPSAPGSIKVVVQIKVDANSNLSATEIHKHLQDKINNNQLEIRDTNNNKLEISNDQNVGVEITPIDEEDNSLQIAIILGVVTAVLIIFIILIGFAISKKLKKGQEKILPFNKKLTPYLNPTYKSFHNENTLDGTIESLVRIRRRSDQFTYEFDKACWDSGKGIGMGSHIIKPSGPSLNSTGRRHSQPPSLTSTIRSNKSIGSRTMSPPMPGYVDDNSV